MEDAERRDERTFRVVCVWCGAEIRRASTPESPGMCQSCFRQMVEEHTRYVARQHAGARHAGAQHASDR